MAVTSLSVSGHVGGGSRSRPISPRGDTASPLLSPHAIDSSCLVAHSASSLSLSPSRKWQYSDAEENDLGYVLSYLKRFFLQFIHLNFARIIHVIGLFSFLFVLNSFILNAGFRKLNDLRNNTNTTVDLDPVVEDRGTVSPRLNSYLLWYKTFHGNEWGISSYHKISQFFPIHPV